MTKFIPLSQGLFSLVDDEDFPSLAAHKWYAHTARGKTYVRRNTPSPSAKSHQTTVWMHRVVLAAVAGSYVDHINGDTLDNRRSNLRIVTHSQNQANRRLLQPNNTSGYRGVTYSKRRQKWIAQIIHMGRRREIGVFETAEAAARAYDKALVELHGAFARSNFGVRP